MCATIGVAGGGEKGSPWVLFMQQYEEKYLIKILDNEKVETDWDIKSICFT